MSDPVSNVEIEDVLSSIRRLVSDENRNSPRPELEDEPYKPSRLVLTPSLLVPVGDLAAQESKTPEMFDEDADPTDTAPEQDDVVEVTQDHQEDNSDYTGQSFDDQTAGTTEALLRSESDPFHEAGSDVDQASDAMPGPSDVNLDETSEPEAPEAAWPPWSNPDAILFMAAERVAAGEYMLEDDEEYLSGESFPEEEDAYSEPPEAPDEAEVEATVEDATAEEATAEDATVEDAPLEEATTQQPDTDDKAGHLEAATEEVVSEPETEPLDDIAAEIVEPVEDTEQDQFAESDADVDDTPADGVSSRAATLSAKIAALEAKIGQTSDQWEPDGELGDDYAGTRVETIEWQDHEDEVEPSSLVPEADSALEEAEPESALEDAEPEVALEDAEPESAPEDAEPESVPEEAEVVSIDEPVDDPDVSSGQPDQTSDEDRLDLLGSDDAILDEESLRELVADIVRQELQGALGERITRNVRKLVRREIHRALTAQELD